MTITEPLETARRAEVRRNCVCRSSSPEFQLLRIAAGAEHGQDNYPFWFNQKMNHKGETGE